MKKHHSHSVWRMLMVAAGLAATPSFVAAQTDPQEVTQEQIIILEREMERQPENLDLYFTYATLANARGEHRKAVQAYRHMLELNPQLDRVRLDLAMSYARLGNYQEAMALMREVLSRDIPEQVRETIERVLKDLEQSATPGRWSGFIATGINWDSNANSASDSNRITIFDTSVPLPQNDRKTDDAQVFASAGLQHTYRLSEPAEKSYALFWESSASLYQNEQNHLDQFDLMVYSLKTGPKVEIPSLATSLSLNANYAHIVLEGHTYLRQTTTELASQTALSEDWRLSAGLAREFREYENAPDVTTYADRTGAAEQARIGLSYSLTPGDIFDVETTGRLEDTKQGYYDNKQVGTELGYTRQFSEGLFGRGTIGIKQTLYDENDPLISTRRRVELETSCGYALTKLFTPAFSATAAYQYRDINASLQNYEYDNHRLGVSFSWRY